MHFEIFCIKAYILFHDTVIELYINIIAEFGQSTTWLAAGTAWIAFSASKTSQERVYIYTGVYNVLSPSPPPLRLIYSPAYDIAAGEDCLTVGVEAEDPPRKFLEFITKKDNILWPFTPFLCNFTPIFD